MKPFVALLSLAVASPLVACWSSSMGGETPYGESKPRPNIVVVMVDDLGWQDTSLALHIELTHLNRRYHTPNVERLAARGMRFTNAYAAAPVCTPTRASLITGRSPGRNHITYWTFMKDRDTSASYPGVRAPAWNMNGVQEGDTTLPRLLQGAGYRTIHVGKAHFGAIETSGADPRRLGFDVNIAGHGPGAPGSYYGEHGFRSGERTGKGGPSAWDVPGLDAYHGEDIYLTEALALEAAKAVREAVAAERPFFLNFAPYAVHTPIMANDRYLERYADLHEREAAYATMVESVDTALGDLLDLFDEIGVADNTIVIYTGDNGGLSAHGRGGEAHTHNSPLRSGKGSAYEGGVRVPQVIAWPGVTDRPTSTDEPVITYDLFPTILEWADVEVPPEHEPSLDGVSLAALVRDETALEPRPLYWHQPHFWGVNGPGIWPFTSVRDGDWKLVFRHSDRGFELYNLASDLGERRDLARTHPERVAQLAAEMDEWFERTDAQPSIDIESNEAIGLPSEFVPQ